MWSTLVSLIERWWREKPRLDLVRSVVHLRDSMKLCQERYEACMEAKAAGTLENRCEPHPELAWTHSLAILGCAVIELDQVLEIFDVRVHQSIRDYQRSESVVIAAQGVLGGAAQALNKPLEIDIHRVEISSSFNQALGDLDEFIRKNFKPEEIRAVQDNRWR